MNFDNHQPGLESPASDAFSVTPSDAVDLPAVTRAVYVGWQGDLHVLMHSGADVTLVGVSGMLPIRIRRVMSTGTTATNIVGLA